LGTAGPDWGWGKAGGSGGGAFGGGAKLW
jgi:hypothetical protein